MSKPAAPNRRLQRTRFAPEDRLHFRNRIRADCHLALDGAPLKRSTLGGHHHRLQQLQSFFHPA
jgi:hypothetical protein